MNNYAWILLIALTTALVSINSRSLNAQETSVQEGFTGSGIAKISGGDIEGARQQALADAQRKAIMEAISALVPLEVIENNFLILKNTFFNKPATYIQSFKILYENTTFDAYHMSIQAMVQQDVLKKGLESIGLVTQPKEPLKVLVMIAEKGPARDDYSYWWSAPAASPRATDSDQKLRDFLTEKGFTVIDPAQTVKEPASFSLIQNPEPDINTACQLGAQYGADLVIAGKAEIQRSKGTETALFSAFQCNLTAQVISIKDRRAIISTASYGLGVNTDESIAYKNSIDKTCKQLSDTLVDKIKMLPWGSQ
jgi:hypothetical protein